MMAYRVFDQRFGRVYSAKGEKTVLVLKAIDCILTLQRGRPSGQEPERQRGNDPVRLEQTAGNGSG
jgi:hypothetical protein